MKCLGYFSMMTSPVVQYILRTKSEWNIWRAMFLIFRPTKLSYGVWKLSPQFSNCFYFFFIHMDHSSCKRTSYESLSCHIDKILTNTVTNNNCEFDIKRQKFKNIMQNYKAEILPWSFIFERLHIKRLHGYCILKYDPRQNFGDVIIVSYIY